jgi:sulfatase modifying factor 1
MRRRVLGAILFAVALVLLTGASGPAPQRRQFRLVPRSMVSAAPQPSATPPPPPAPAPYAGVRGSCPADMLMVDGAACSEVEQRCLAWLPELPGSPPRCARFAPNASCAGVTTRMHFCIDRFEYPNREGQLPAVNRSWEQASELCAARGRRLCKSKEWTLACEGEERLPYPYGHARDDEACNVDRPMLGPFPRPVQHVPKPFAHMPLVDWRVPSGEMDRCVSPFGVRDMTGNVDEWVVNESGKPYPSGLKGGYWGPVRDGCRPMTVAHDQKFSFYQIGFRCCADLPRAR